MKKIVLVLLLMVGIMNQTSFAQTKPAPQAQLLKAYYQVKDALVNGNGETAATSAEDFVKLANTIDYKVVSEGNITVLVKDAGAISATKDIKKQREAFANLSKNMALVAKTVKLTGDPIYKQYCPMKKAYWLSDEKTIKNPYYGSSMLSCGSVEETIK